AAAAPRMSASRTTAAATRPRSTRAACSSTSSSICRPTEPASGAFPTPAHSRSGADTVERVAATRTRIERLAFRGRWRHYQELALEAFQCDADAGRRRTHIVAPPGSGKTLIGLEIMRRLGAWALVLVPNT